MDKIKTLEEARELFNQRGFSFSVGSIKFLLDHKKTFSEVADMSKEENCVYLLAAAIPEHDREKAIEIIFEFMDKGVGVRLLHYLLKELARDQDFFMSQTNLEIFEEISKTSDQVSNLDLVNMVSEEMIGLNKNLEYLI